MLNNNTINSNQGSKSHAGATTSPQFRKFNQKEAVYEAVKQVFGGTVEFESGMDISSIINSEQRKFAVDALVQGFKDGEIVLFTEFPSEQALRTYCTGLLSNWLRKDTRLNGGGKYAPKHPGRGRAPADAQIKALQALMAQVKDPTEKKEIQQYIDARRTEIGAQASVIKNVDIEALPPGLRTKYSHQAANKKTG